MGFLYKACQHAAYESMNKARENGKEVDKEREKAMQKEKYNCYGGYSKLDNIVKKKG